MANTAWAEEVIHHNTAQAQVVDKVIGQAIQDYILYIIIQEKDLRLIKQVQTD